MRGAHGYVLIRRTRMPAFWRTWHRLRHRARGIGYHVAWFVVLMLAERKHIDKREFFGTTLADAW